MPLAGWRRWRSSLMVQPMSAFIRNRNLLGVASLCLGALIFSLQDAIIKSISGDHAVTLAIVLRCLVALPLLTIMVQMEAGLHRLSSRNIGIMLLRGGMLLVAYTSYFLALPALPLAEAIALYFTVPIIVTLLSGPLLGERVGFRSWVAVGAGFVGILIILQPGSALFEPAALLSLVSATTYALAMLIARRIGVAEPAAVMAFHQNAVYLTGAGLAAIAFNAFDVTSLGHPSLDFLVRPWAMPGTIDLVMMGLCGVIAAAGMWLLTNAYRMADASLVTVFEYTGMIWAPLWGFLFFAEVPRWTTVLGTVIIIIAGVFAVRAAAPARVTEQPSTATARRCPADLS